MTEEDVRRIIREELAAAKKTPADEMRERYAGMANDQRAESFPDPRYRPIPLPMYPHYYSPYPTAQVWPVRP